MPQLPIIRSILSVPALRQRFIDKAVAVPADVVLFDLEDSIAPAQKRAARTAAAAAGPRFDKRGRRLFVRPNDLSTGLLEHDLDAVVGPWLDGLHLPKVHNPGVIERVDAYLHLLERSRGMAPGSVALIAWIESTEGVGCVEAIAHSSARLCAMSMGAEDYATDLGVERTPECGEIAYARARVANAAAAASLVAIDCPEPNYRDLDHFERDILRARAVGYRGKYCIHPSQVTIANRVFSPSPDQLAWARRVVDAYERAEREEGVGAVGLDGSMIDRPVYQRAADLLAWEAVIPAPQLEG